VGVPAKIGRQWEETMKMSRVLLTALFTGLLLMATPAKADIRLI
jgi:hypothetical protein